MAVINKRIMVDMSATLIHHGHVRLLREASKLGSVIVGLTTDEEIRRKKHYDPELAFEFRKEILESIKYVSEVVPTPWLIDDDIIDQAEDTLTILSGYVESLNVENKVELDGLMRSLYNEALTVETV